MRVVIIGNGATAVGKDCTHYINQHTGTFLLNLADSGSDICFIQPKEVYEHTANLHDFSLSTNKVECIAIDKTLNSSLFRNFPKFLLRLLQSDFVYLFYPGTFPQIVARICLLIGKPYGLYLRGEKFSTTGYGGNIFLRAKFITTVSASLGQTIKQLNSSIIPIRPMLDITDTDTMRRDFRSRSKRPWRLLFVGRLEEAKGVIELIEAALILQNRDFSFNLSLVGGGVLYKELSNRYGNNENAPIRVLGPIQDKAALMSEYEAADFFILPTHNEGFPRVLYEAMIKSMVILTTFVGGIPGLMSDGVNCVEIPVKSPEAIADSIIKISRNQEMMQLLSENGLETFLKFISTNPTHFEAVNGQLDA